MVGLFLEERLHVEAEHAHHQLGMAMGFAVVGALLLGALRPRRLPAEATVGAAWVAASAAVVLGVSRLVHASHDLGGMVFGNAVAVPDDELHEFLALEIVAELGFDFVAENAFLGFVGDFYRCQQLKFDAGLILGGLD